jgi:hypothetical protein
MAKRAKIPHRFSMEITENARQHAIKAVATERRWPEGNGRELEKVRQEWRGGLRKGVS